MLVCALAAAGCGSTTNGEQSKPAATILADARTAAAAASSVHVVGSTQSVGLDLTIDAGRGAKGTMTQNGTSFQIVRIADVVYIQAPPQFYIAHGAPAGAAELLKGRWLKASATRRDLAAFVVLTESRELFPRLLARRRAPVKSTQTTVAGMKAIGITDQSGQGRLDVSLAGKPYPLLLSGRGGRFTFSDWGKPVSLGAPPNAIDTSNLG